MAACYMPGVDIGLASYPVLHGAFLQLNGQCWRGVAWEVLNGMWQDPRNKDCLAWTCIATRIASPVIQNAIKMDLAFQKSRQHIFRILIASEFRLESTTTAGG